MSEDSPRIREWLRRLTWSLSAVPSPEREEIVAEAHAHLREAMANGQSAEAALAGFGAAEDYGREFVDQMDVSGALGSGRYGAMLSVVGRRVQSSFAAALAGMIMIIIGGVMAATVVVMIYKLIDPTHTGLWLGTHQFFLGKIDDPAQARDLIGGWIYLVCTLLFAAAWLLGRNVLLWTLRRLARR
jgi:hypothetical protein